MCSLLFFSCAPERPSDLKTKGAAHLKKASEDGTKQQAVAVVNGQVLTLGDYERRLQHMPLYARVRYATKEKRKELLNSMVIMELLAAEAEHKGYGADPTVIQSMKEAMVRRMLQEELRQRALMKDVDDAQIKTYYNAHKDRYMRPEQRRILGIAGDSRAQVEAWRKQILGATKDPSKLNERFEAFRHIAYTHSRHLTSRVASGDLGFMEPPNITKKNPKRSIQAFGLTFIGDISAPFKDDDMWWIVMLLERRPQMLKPLDEVARKIRTELHKQLQKKEREAFVKQLRKNATVETFDDILEQATTPTRRLEVDTNTTPQLFRRPLRDLKKRAP